ncbi:MAG: DHH family phosphoesterase [Paludibacteraceae bacterium]|nr:DHH family phosphoesterase [Paludibacteraceae bacterium]
MIHPLIDTQLISRAKQLIDQAQTIVVVTHISPDGDAMGSSLAMRWFLLDLGKRVTVIVPNEFPAFLSWLPGAQDDVIFDKDPDAATALLDAADLVIVTDFQEPKRSGKMADWFTKNSAPFPLSPATCPHTPIIMIDHHLHPSDMADVTISYPQCASASELVYRFILQYIQSSISECPEAPLNAQRYTLNAQLSTCIYTGMMTDTGNFQFNSNDAEMYEIVAELMRAGVNKDECYDKVFNQYHEGRMRLVGYCLHTKMRVFPEHHVALIALSSKELKQFNFRSGDAEGIVNMPLQISSIYYSVFMREDTDKIKLSFRSQGDRPVNTFAADIFNGGGHKNAAGGEHYGTLREAVHLFLNNYEKYCK